MDERSLSKLRENRIAEIRPDIQCDMAGCQEDIPGVSRYREMSKRKGILGNIIGKRVRRYRVLKRISDISDSKVSGVLVTGH